MSGHAGHGGDPPGVTIDRGRLAQVTRLERAGHRGPAEGFCVMELCAYIAREPWSDRPRCACPVIARYAMQLNDRMPDEQRQRLLPYVVRIAGSRATPRTTRRRGYHAATLAVTVFAPLALDAAGLPAPAATLRAVPAIADRATARAARDAAAAAAADADAADADAADAAYAAADAAAYAASAAAAAAADAAAYAAADAAGAADAYAAAAAAAAYAAYAADAEAAAAAYAADAAAAAAADAAAAAGLVWDAALHGLDQLLAIGEAA